MKRFLLVALILVSAASAYAADLKITGDAEVRGLMFNAEYDGDTVWKDKFFDANFNFNCALAVTENTTVFTKLTFDAQQEGTAVVPDSEAADAVTMLGVERAYISTKFLPALTVDAGLLGGGQWGTAFGNTESNVTRIKGTYAVSDDIKVMAIYEKNAESNSDALYAAGYALAYKQAYAAAYLNPASPTYLDEDASAEVADGLAKTNASALEISEGSDFGDTTSYYLAANIKTAGITILPLFKYVDKQTEVMAAKKLGIVTDAEPYAMSFDLAVMGDMGMVGFEAEVIYAMTKWDDFGGLEDETTYGVYANVFAKLEMAKAGVALFYESTDEKKGTFKAGEDFDFTLIYEDLIFENIAGMMAGKLYASDIKIVDKITADVAFAYGMQTDKDVDMNSDFSEVTFWEVDAGVNYAIDAATTYTIEGGYCSIDTSDKALNTYQVIQKFNVKF